MFHKIYSVDFTHLSVTCLRNYVLNQYVRIICFHIIKNLKRFISLVYVENIEKMQGKHFHLKLYLKKTPPRSGQTFSS